MKLAELLQKKPALLNKMKLKAKMTAAIMDSKILANNL